MATMKDVANLAGVSTATLSRVINRTSYVEPVTQERVEEVARGLCCLIQREGMLSPLCLILKQYTEFQAYQVL